LPPLDFALFIRAGLVLQPTLLAIEPVLTWPAPKGKSTPVDENYKILHEQILRCPKLLLAAELGDPSELPVLQHIPTLRHVNGDASRVDEFPDAERSPLDDLRLSATLGFTNLPGNGAGPIRRVPLVYRYAGQVVPSFVLQSAMLWLQLTPDDMQVHFGSHIKLGDKLQIPIDDTGAMRVDFNSKFSRIELDDLLLSVSQIESGKKPLVSTDALKGKQLLLVRADSAARTVRFPSGEMRPPGELFAAAIATIQSYSIPRPFPLWGDVLIVAGVLGLSCCFSRLGSGGAVFVALTALPIYLMGFI
jgi:hypothetical protein